MTGDLTVLLVVFVAIGGPFAIAALLEDHIELRWADRLLRGNTRSWDGDR